MATKKTKTLADVATVTTVTTSQYIPLTDANGNANNNTKATNQNRVRAVSAPLQIASTNRR